MKKTILKNMSALLVILAMTCTVNLNAQALPPGGPTNTVDNIPLDGGLSILLAGAAFFGIKKLRGNKEA